MTRSTTKSLELTKVNSSKIRSTRAFSLSDYQVSKLLDFVFAQRILSRSTTTKLSEPPKSGFAQREWSRSASLHSFA